jgi:hypothetical protein
VGEIGTSISAVNAAGGQLPVRAIDPVRRRLPGAEEAAQSRAQVFAPDYDGADDFTASAQEERRGGARGGFGSLLGAFTSFIATLFAQADTEAAAQPTASAQAATAAYGRGSILPAVAAYEVLPPSLPRLSSGRALDLTV